MSLKSCKICIIPPPANIISWQSQATCPVKPSHMSFADYINGVLVILSYIIKVGIILAPSTLYSSYTHTIRII